MIFLFQTRGKPTYPRKKIAGVLPFENLRLAEDAYFSDGITGEITRRYLGSELLPAPAPCSTRTPQRGWCK
ncbi:hypothetical protein IIC38_15400 [candidate division KSB1 bacterium]|nr:hypothetical protein [candidate division KSB1 bacterium]